MDVAVTGSTGFIGSALVDALTAAGHRAIRIVRGSAKGDEIVWDPDAGTIDAASLEGIDGVVHLAGAGIGDHRWTDAYKLTIRRSRTNGTTLIARTLAGLAKRPSVLVSGSAVGYYGDRGDEVLDETSSPGTGFLPEVCVAWEAATAAAAEAGVRVVTIRSGIVLSPRGGALKRQLPLFKLGLGGKLGTGRQWQSWITLDDEVGAILHLLTGGVTGAVTGPVNLTTPHPVTNAEFTKTLAGVLHRPSFVPIPSFGPKLVLGSELADILLFEGQRVLPRVLEDSGYTFAHPRLEEALRSLLDRPAAA
jgi:uncharacterized protein (TIGR01777 family)